MDKLQKVKYWMDIADYDLETAKAMFDTKRYLYVGFMCHQAVEKILKAYYSKVKNELPPYIHNLSRLAELSGIIGDLSKEQLSFLDYMMPLNIKARYPDYKDKIYKSLNKTKSKEILEETKNFIEWVKEKL